MKLENQVCSLALAKRLKELGVEQESLYYYCEEQDRQDRPPSGMGLYDWETSFHRKHNAPHLKQYSAFSVAELGEMLPTSLDHLGITHILTVNHWGDDNKWQISYLGGAINDEPLFNLVIEDLTEANARANTVIYFKEKGLTP